MSPDVSILVPVYNVARFIEKCSVSLFEQSLKNIEYIFLDDCSPDNSIDILRSVIARYPERADRVSILRQDRNRGLAAARNTLIEHATGKYILHVDSDDYLEKECAEILLRKAEEEHADIVVSDIFRERASETVIQQVRFSQDKTAYINLVLSSQSPSYNCGKLIKTALYREHDIRCKEGVNVLEDYHTLPRLAYHAQKIVKIDVPLYHYIQFNENAYTKNCNEKFMRNVCEAIEVVESFFRAVEDGDKYTRSISAFKIMTKINNVKHADRQLQKRIIELFPEIDSIDSSEVLRLSTFDNLLYRLIRQKQAFLIYLLTNALDKATSIKQQLIKSNTDSRN
jgi:glycosyltransferase involved in cell wall biosynthesis